MTTMDSYLGDGVYASFDGFGIVLDLRGQDITTRIVLEPAVFTHLVEYEATIRKRLAEDAEAKKIDDAYEHHIQNPEQQP